MSVESAPVSPEVCPGLPQASGTEQDCVCLVYLKMLSKFVHFSMISVFMKTLLRTLCAQVKEKKSQVVKSAMLTAPLLGINRVFS